MRSGNAVCAGGWDGDGRLNAAGHRTKAGRLFSYKAVLTILKNPTYIGEVAWRGERYPGEHQPIVDPELFARAHTLLAERSEEPAKRASHSSDYLLSGLVVCSCGTHCVGIAATGRSHTYRYYTCHARQRYGKNTCPLPRLPADTLDDAIVTRLVDMLHDSDLIATAAARAAAQATDTADILAGERSAIETELADIDAATERYLHAFERGTMPEDICAPRLQALSTRAGQLKTRLADLVAKTEQAALSAPDPAALDHLRVQLTHAIASDSRQHLKALLAALVHEVRVEGPNTVRPVFKIPAAAPTTDSPAVREPSRMVEVMGLESPTSPLRACPRHPRRPGRARQLDGRPVRRSSAKDTERQ